MRKGGEQDTKRRASDVWKGPAARCARKRPLWPARRLEDGGVTGLDVGAAVIGERRAGP